MNTPNKTFSQVLNNSPARDRIIAKQTRITCPLCGLLLAKAEPTTTVKDLILYCRKCRKSVRVDFNIAREP